MDTVLGSFEPGSVISSVGQGDLIGYYTISPSSSVGTAYCPGSGALRERSGFYYCEDGFEVEGGSVYEIGRSCSGENVLVERFTGRESTGSTLARQCSGDLGCETAYILEAWSERGSTGTLITCQDSIGIETSVGVMYITEPTRLPSTFTETLNPNEASQTLASTIPSSTGSGPEQTGGGDDNGSDSKGGGTNTGLIAGVVVGVVVGIGIIVIGIFILIRRRKKKGPDDPEKSQKGFMGVLRRIPRPTVTWSRPPDENKGPDTKVIQKAELPTGPETEVKAKATANSGTVELETRERPGELSGREVQQGPFEMDATPVSKEAAAAASAVPDVPVQNAEGRVEEAKTNDTQEDAKKEVKTDAKTS